MGHPRIFASRLHVFWLHVASASLRSSPVLWRNCRSASKIEESAPARVRNSWSVVPSSLDHAHHMCLPASRPLKDRTKYPNLSFSNPREIESASQSRKVRMYVHGPLPRALAGGNHRRPRPAPLPPWQGRFVCPAAKEKQVHGPPTGFSLVFTPIDEFFSR